MNLAGHSRGARLNERVNGGRMRKEEKERQERRLARES